MNTQLNYLTGKQNKKGSSGMNYKEVPNRNTRKYKIEAQGSTSPTPQKNCTRTGMLTWPESPTAPLTGLSV
jgi:hypothetical protein